MEEEQQVMGVGENRGWWVPCPQGRTRCELRVSLSGNAPRFPGSTGCRLIPGTGTKQCRRLSRDAGLAEMPLRHRTLSRGRYPGRAKVQRHP